MNKDPSTITRGIVFALAGFAFFATKDAIVRLMAGGVSPFMLGFLACIFSLLLTPIMKDKSDKMIHLIRPKNPKLWILRGVLQTIGIVSGIVAFTLLPIVEAFSLIFLMPIMISILSMIFLKEKVNLSTWITIAIGLAGTMIVLRPGLRELSIGHLAAFTLTFTSASVFVILRHLKDKERTISHFGAATLLPLAFNSIFVIPTFEMPAMSLWPYIASYATFIALGNLMVIFASRNAPANLIAPTQYSQIIWAVGYGSFLFHDPIDLPTIAGLTLILCAGLWKFTPLQNLGNKQSTANTS
ncbi:DMT family transporter [Hirschia baltica]|uniref:EamA domain-containing protein n=1 Tax=Hirschia baltica (strain ATCC 49814 / DSM 5838 / IFAM 1418) TaxID=582402 RepID=C6XP40_HIRBI|nr:DMT family transporter [Hirschia baltica]ACT60220.1 protein of unknown function DUF6 transmembrane [Hirschia baltica ATCC 49814]